MLLPLGILASSGGAAADYELISSTLLTGSQAVISFNTSSLSAYKHLQIRATSRTDVASVYVDTRLRFNTDTGSNYSSHELYGAGGTPASGGSGGLTSAGIAYSAGSSAASYVFSGMVIDILDFAATTKNKTARSLSGIAAASNLIDLRSGVWHSLSAVTQIDLSTSGNFVAGSRFSLYGLKG